MKKTLTLLLCSSSLCLLAAAAPHQSQILNETWPDGTRNVQNLPDSAQWFASGPSSTLTNGPDGLTLEANGTSRYALTYFTSPGTGGNVTPLSIGKGQTLKVAYDFSFTGIPADGSPWLRIGLFNSTAGNSSRITADNMGETNSAYNNYQGYLIDEANLQTGNARLYKRKPDVNSSNLMLSTSDSNIYTGLGAANTDWQGYGSGIVYTGIINISHNIDDTVTITHSVYGADNSLIYSLLVTDSTNAYTEFDTLSFALSRLVTSMTLHSVTVDLVAIPEPSSMALFGTFAAVAVCLAARARRNSARDRRNGAR